MPDCRHYTGSLPLNDIRPTLPRQGHDRLVANNGQCTENWPSPLRLIYPDFAKIPAEPGSIGYSVVGFDIDNDGKVTNAHTLSSDSNRALDEATTAAVKKWRYTTGPRKGCFYPFYRNQTAPIQPPPAPESSTFINTGSVCENRRHWMSPPVLKYPDNYRRRAIEGWAVIRYDIAPWGEVGNVQVLASEPSDEFGDAAKIVIQRARDQPSKLGASGCVDTIRFKMGSRKGDGKQRDAH